MKSLVSLSLNNIGKRYRGQWLFRHISLDLRSGDSLSVTGKNGSGKSTLLQIIYGLVQPGEGEVLVGGEQHARADRIFAFTSPYLELPGEFSISEILELYRGIGKMKMSDEMFLEYSMFSKVQADGPVRHFSSGMLQRLKTALCLASDAGILLMDEPLTNMDANGELWYKNCVADLKDRIVIVAGNNPAEYDFTKGNLRISD